MADFSQVDPDAALDIDISQFSVDDIVEGIGNRALSDWDRDKAMAVAVEVLASRHEGEPPRAPEERRIVQVLIQVGRDPSEPPLLQERAGDSLGLVWIWSDEAERETFASLTPIAQRAAREVLGSEHPVVGDVPPSSEA